MQFQISSRKKAAKEIFELSKLIFLEKSLTKILLDQMQKITRSPSNKGDSSPWSLLRMLLAIHQKSQETSFWEKIDSFFSICKFGSFKNTFATNISLPEFHFRCRWFILLVQTKDVISVSYGSSTSSWKQWTWIKLHLILRTPLNISLMITKSSQSTQE